MVYGCHPRRAFRYPRARVERVRLSNGLRAFQPFRLADDFRRGSGMKMVKRMSATLDETRKLAPAAAGRWFAPLKKRITTNDEPPLHVRFAFSDFSISAFSISDFPHWLHRAGTCAWSRTGASAEPLPTRQMSARFRPRTTTDSPALHPLHSISLQFRRLHFHSIAFRRPQTGETVRNKSCAPE